jgi:hypothetical protein
MGMIERKLQEYGLKKVIPLTALQSYRRNSSRSTDRLSTFLF